MYMEHLASLQEVEYDSANGVKNKHCCHGDKGKVQCGEKEVTSSTDDGFEILVQVFLY